MESHYVKYAGSITSAYTSSLGSESISLNSEYIGVCLSVCLSPTNKDGVYVLHSFFTFYAAKRYMCYTLFLHFMLQKLSKMM
jgi:hypothetical protein